MFELLGLVPNKSRIWAPKPIRFPGGRTINAGESLTYVEWGPVDGCAVVKRDGEHEANKLYLVGVREVEAVPDGIVNQQGAEVE